MNNLILATQAHAKSKVNLKKKIAEEQKRAFELECKKKQEVEKENLEYKKSITKKIIDEINYSIKNGKLSAEVILQENWNFKFETKCFKFDSVIKELVEELKFQQYDVYYGKDSVYHDTSFDYMNSGGECGSSEPYYTDVLGLRIKWDKK
jgi:hypothetical protein